MRIQNNKHHNLLIGYVNFFVNRSVITNLKYHISLHMYLLVQSFAGKNLGASKKMVSISKKYLYVASFL